MAIQVILGVIVLYWGAGKRALQAASNSVQAIIDSSNEGIEFLFGPILPKEGLVFAFQVLPVIIFFAALTSVLYHWHILQWVVKLIGGVLQFALRTSKAESTFAASTIFVGMSGAAARREAVHRAGDQVRALHHDGHRPRDRRGFAASSVTRCSACVSTT